MHNGKIRIMTIRHGKTEFNLQHRYAGLLDVPLNEKGINDCQAASKDFDESVDVVVTSKLKRAIQTARLLTGPDKPIVETALCNERNFGTMQGHTPPEVESLRPEIHYIKIGGDFHCLNPPRGERLPALYRRAKEFHAFLRLLASERRCARILVVSHEVFLLLFHGVLRGETWRESLSHVLHNLTLSAFVLQGNRLLGEESRKLASDKQESWQKITPYQPSPMTTRAADLAYSLDG